MTLNAGAHPSMEVDVLKRIDEARRQVAFKVQTASDHDRHGTVASFQLAGPHARESVVRLGFVLARQAKLWIRRTYGSPNPILCVVLLRGGALLYPGFVHHFASAEFRFLAMRRRVDGAVQYEYSTRSTASKRELTLYIDPVVGTGRTMLAARHMIEAVRGTGLDVGVCLCAARLGAATLHGERMGLIGFRLDDELDGSIVRPGLGLDAGDLFAKPR